MKLNLAERHLLLQILPVHEDITILRIARDLRMALAVTEEEYKEFGIVQEATAFKWNEKGEEEREIPIGEKATDVCVKALKDANKAKTLTEQHISLYDKFIKNE